MDPGGQIHPGRVRILPLNPAFCFPEFHPHDRDAHDPVQAEVQVLGHGARRHPQVMTYTEVLTEERIEEFINDELIRDDPNTLGEIPIIHIPNTAVASSPWGLSDIHGLHLAEPGVQREGHRGHRHHQLPRLAR